MIEVVPSILWAAVVVYAVRTVQAALLAWLASQAPKSDIANALIRAEIEKLRTDLTKTARVASSASLAAGLREEGK